MEGAWATIEVNPRVFYLQIGVVDLNVSQGHGC